MIHPAHQLSEEIIQQIRKHAEKAENLGRLTNEQMEIVHNSRWLRLFVPEKYGGLHLSLPEAVRLEEGIAYADGSLGWVVTLCAGAGLFVGYLDETIAKKIFDDPHACLAGSGKLGGVARMVEDGFEITGSWPYSSGAPHATYFTANCLMGTEGRQMVRSFIFRREEVLLSDNWNYMGLKATGGYAYAVDRLIVPSNRAFIIDAAHSKLPDPVYRYPFLQLAEATISANISGMCLYFFDLAKELISGQDILLFQNLSEELMELRHVFYERLDESWQAHGRSNFISDDLLNKVSGASTELARQARKSVNLIFPFCGLIAARTDTAINRVWRNINTAGQHSLLHRIKPQ